MEITWEAANSWLRLKVEGEPQPFSSPIVGFIENSVHLQISDRRERAVAIQLIAIRRSYRTSLIGSGIKGSVSTQSAASDNLCGGEVFRSSEKSSERNEPSHRLVEKQ